MTDKAPWITYRPELQILDCTIRDGGLINNHQFTDEVVHAVYQACIAAGVDAMEIGYKNSPRQFPTDQFGPWKHCDEQDIRRIVGDHDSKATGLRLAAMADAGGKSDWQKQIVPKVDSPLDIIRVACYVSQIPEAVQMIHHAHEMGYETTCNIMAISAVQDAEIDQALEEIAETPAGTIVVVDSYGALYREQVDDLIKRYTAAAAPTGKQVGIHAHNNLQLAFANTIEAIILGANRADATLMGLGRGAGNCPMEILIGFLKNPKFKQRPIIDVIQKHILPLKQKLDWGPSIPYNLTGRFNMHPRSAMAFRAGDTPDDYVKFYDQTISDV